MTMHSLIRAKERTGLSTKASIKFIHAAMEHGIGLERFPERERHYMSEREEDDKTVLFYSGYIFIMSSDNCCITMYPAPVWFGKKAYYDKKTMVRNPKKYNRFYRNEI